MPNLRILLYFIFQFYSQKMILTLVYNIAQFLFGSSMNNSLIMRISLTVAVAIYAVIYFKFGQMEILASYLQNTNYLVIFIGADLIACAISKYFWGKLHDSANISVNMAAELLSGLPGENGVHPDSEEMICDPNTGMCMLKKKEEEPSTTNSEGTKTLETNQTPETAQTHQTAAQIPQTAVQNISVPLAEGSMQAVQNTEKIADMISVGDGFDIKKANQIANEIQMDIINPSSGAEQ